jgi:3-oxo-5-alpha-steroid 4-dehydrogenase 1
MSLYIFNLIVWTWIIMAVMVFIVLIFVPAPYGRFTSKSWGILIPDRMGWFFMEIPSLLVFTWFFIAGDAPENAALIFTAGLWILHYLHRSLIFPFRIRTKKKKMPLAIPAMAVFFNLVNGFLNGYYLGNMISPDGWYRFTNPILVTGGLLFFAGLVINLQSDEILIHLRKNSENGYAIPYGGMFRWVSCPNYLGELMEWAGFALMAWNLAALSFFLWTFANLVPRALNYQQWYKKTFPAYPPERKAIIPFLL